MSYRILTMVVLSSLLLGTPGSHLIGQHAKDEGDDNADGVKPQKVIEASEFRLVDSKGRLHGKWMARDEMSMMAFMDPENEKMRAGFGVTPDGTALLTLCNNKGQCRANVAVARNGQTQISLTREADKPVGTWSLDPNGRIAFEQRDPDGRLRQQISVNQDGSAGMVIFDDQERLVTVYQAAADGGPGLVMYNPDNGTMRLSATVDATEGMPMINLNRADGSPIVTLAEASSGAALAFNDSNGRQTGLIGITPRGDSGVLFFDAGGKTLARIPQGFDANQWPTGDRVQNQPTPRDRSRPQGGSRRRGGR